MTRGGVELRYCEWPGDPPPTLLLHGIGNYGRYWDLFARAIDGRLRLVAPDARGHGDSGRPEHGYEPEEFVADALAVLDALAIDRALVVGHSMGGSHSIRLAADHPDRVRGLVLVDVGPEPMREGMERARRLLTGRPRSFRDRDEALAYFRRTSPGYGDDVYRNRLDWALREDDGSLLWRSDPNALERIMARRGDRRELWTKLGALRCPTLIVRGTRSNVLGAEGARRMMETIPTARLIELEAGHNVALDRPAELADAVVRLARER